jgi:hypothetical protein
MRRHSRLSFLAACEPIQHAGVDGSRRNGIDANAQRRGFQCGGLGQTFHCVLAGHVDRGAGSAHLAQHRRDIDDAATALLLHHADLVLHAQQHAQHIGIKRGRVAGGGLFGDGARLAFRAGIVNGCIQPAEALDRAVDQRTHLRVITHIRPDELNLSASSAQFFGQRLARLLMAA